MISDDATYTSFIHSSQVVFLCVYVRFFSLSPSIHRTVLLSESSFTPTSKTSLSISSSTPFPFSSHFSTHRHSVLRTIPYRSAYNDIVRSGKRTLLFALDSAALIDNEQIAHLKQVVRSLPVSVDSFESE